MSLLEVEIVSAGARSSLGRSLPGNEAAVRAGVSVVEPHPFIPDVHGRLLNVARAHWLPPSLLGARRFVLLAKNAAKEALAPCGRLLDDGAPVEVHVGLPEPRPGRPDGLEDAIARALVRDVPFGSRLGATTSIALGHAAGLVAITRAAERIASGEAEVCLAGGVDTYLEPETLDHLEATGRLRTEGRPWGFTPGEGAAFCVLASRAWAAKARATMGASSSKIALFSAGIEEEPILRGGPEPCLGRGLSAALDAALTPLRARGQRVSRCITDLNGDPYRADEAGFAITRNADAIAPFFRLLAPAQCWGDVGAASGALFAALVFREAARGSPPATLLWASSESGTRVAAVVRAMKTESEEP